METKNLKSSKHVLKNDLNMKNYCLKYKKKVPTALNSFSKYCKIHRNHNPSHTIILNYQ